MSTRPRARPTAAPAPEHTITHAALVEYLGSAAVIELVVAESAPNTYRLEASLSWRAGRSVLIGARGAERSFRSLDTVATFLKTVGIGQTIVRLQLNT